MEQFDGAVAVVTGGGSGIGRGLALALARAGSTVVVADIDRDRADAVADEVGAIGREASGAACDVTDREQVEELAASAWDRHGHVDVIANNAGVFPQFASVLDTDERDPWVDLADGMDPEDVGSLAVEGMRRGDFVIMTHAPVREIADRRTQDVVDAFDALDSR